MKKILRYIVLPSTLVSAFGTLLLSLFPSRGHGPISIEEVPETFAIGFIISFVGFGFHFIVACRKKWHGDFLWKLGVNFSSQFILTEWFPWVGYVEAPTKLVSVWFLGCEKLFLGRVIPGFEGFPDSSKKFYELITKHVGRYSLCMILGRTVIIPHRPFRLISILRG